MHKFNALLAVALFAFLSAIAGCAQIVGVAPPGMESDAAVADSGTVESDTPSVPDATPVVDAGQLEDVQPDAPVHPSGLVTVTCGRPASPTVLTNTNDFSATTMTVAAVGRPVRVLHTNARFGWFGSGHDGFVAGERGDVYFRDFKWRNTSTGRIKQGPASIMLAATADRRRGTVVFNDAYTVEDGEAKTTELLVDVAAHEEMYHELTSRRFAFLFGNGVERSIFGANGIVYADTGEPVPSEDITYDYACFAETRDLEFQVIPRFADMIADMYRDKFVRYDATISPGSRHSLLPFFVMNEGAETGLFDGMQVAVRARNNGTSLRFANFATTCWVTSLTGDVTYGAGTINDDRIVFTGLRVPVAGGDMIPLVVRCSYAWPIEAVGNDIELRAGAYWDAFTMISLGDMGRIMGTTDLQDNREFDRPGSLMITMHQHP